MSDIKQKTNELVRIQGVIPSTPQNQQLLSMNRLLLGVLCFLMSLILLIGMWLIPTSDVLTSYQKISADNVALVTNPVLSPEVNALKGQVIGLVSGSIESKLKSLEESIRLGSVNNSLGTLQDLKNDLKVLRNYSESEPAQKQTATVTNDQLIQEIDHLKNLIYMSIASCGLMFAAAATVWIKHKKRLPYLHTRKSLLDDQ